MNLFPDNWIYVHKPAVQVGRIQNYSNRSKEMSPTPDKTSSLGMEHFCFENDALWSASEDELLALARRELASLGLVKPADILDGKVIRVPKAYPVYGDSYQESIQVVREFVATVPNLQLVDRNGTHRYNNHDHSMLTALVAARNVLGAYFDLWQMHRDTDTWKKDWRSPMRTFWNWKRRRPFARLQMVDESAPRRSHRTQGKRSCRRPLILEAPVKAGAHWQISPRRDGCQNTSLHPLPPLP